MDRMSSCGTTRIAGDVAALAASCEWPGVERSGTSGNRKCAARAAQRHDSLPIMRDRRRKGFKKPVIPAG